MPGKKRGGGSYSDRGLAAALGRISKAKRAAGVMKRARSMGLMSHPASKFGVHYVPAGSAEGVDAYGADYKSASPAQRLKRKADGYYGRGEYWGKAIGGMLGQYSGIPGGGAFLGHVGDKIGDWFKRRFRGRGLYEGRGMYGSPSTAVTGRGLYEGRGAYISSGVGSNNSLISGGQPNMQFHGSPDETSGLTISHTEFIGDVFAPSNSGFNVTSYALNPGLQENFPQLSQYALNFEEYEFIQLVFHYRSTVDASAVNNASGNTGTVIMATDYASSAQSFKDKSQMIGSHGAVTERITEALNHGIECDPSKNMGSAQKTVRNGLIRDRDVSTLDHGKFQIAFQNTPTAFLNQCVGELWCTYTVRLDKPRIFSAASGNVSIYKAVSGGLPSPLALPGVMGGLPMTALANTLQMRLDYMPPLVGSTCPGLICSFPAGTNGVFQIDISVEGTVFIGHVLTEANFALTGNVTFYRDVLTGPTPTAGGNTRTANFFVQATSGTHHLIRVHVAVQAATLGINNSIAIPLMNSATTIIQTEVVVTEISPFLAQSNVNPLPIYVNSSGIILTADGT